MYIGWVKQMSHKNPLETKGIFICLQKMQKGEKRIPAWFFYGPSCINSKVAALKIFYSIFIIQKLRPIFYCYFFRSAIFLCAQMCMIQEFGARKTLDKTRAMHAYGINQHWSFCLHFWGALKIVQIYCDFENF
jgi:hypothetical protein